MIVKCPQCVDCTHYELMKCEIHGNLTEDASRDKCNDFEKKEYENLIHSCTGATK